MSIKKILVIAMVAILAVGGMYGCGKTEESSADTSSEIISSVDTSSEASSVETSSEDSSIESSVETSSQTSSVTSSKTSSVTSSKASSVASSVESSSEEVSSQDTSSEEESTKLTASAKSAKTALLDDTVKLPIVKVIKSVAELDSYFIANETTYALMGDGNDTFDALSVGYTATFFETKSLVVVAFELPSTVTKFDTEVIVDSATAATIAVTADAVEGETMTCWHLAVELSTADAAAYTFGLTTTAKTAE